MSLCQSTVAALFCFVLASLVLPVRRNVFVNKRQIFFFKCWKSTENHLHAMYICGSIFTVAYILRELCTVPLSCAS